MCFWQKITWNQFAQFISFTKDNTTPSQDMEENNVCPVTNESIHEKQTTTVEKDESNSSFPSVSTIPSRLVYNAYRLASGAACYNPRAELPHPRVGSGYTRELAAPQISADPYMRRIRIADAKSS